MAPIPGIYKTSFSGYKTFVPAPLPPTALVSDQTRRLLEEATHLLGQVEMCRTLLPNVDLLIYSSLQREAIASSTIEGTIASPEDLILFQATQRTGNEAAREVNNYAKALTWGCEQLADSRPISHSLILGLHERLLAGVRGHGYAGQLKPRQNRIGSHPNEPIEASVFIPSAPEDTRDLLYALEQYLNNPANTESRITQCALVHYQFETIHPFMDGNGRVGRLLIILQLIHLGLLSAPMIYPSVYFESKRANYYQALQAVRDNGEWDRWIDFFAQGIAVQCGDTIRLTKALLALRQRLQEEITNVRRRAAVASAVEAFFIQPVLSITDIARQAHITYRSAQHAIAELESLHLVDEISGRQKGRLYGCRPVLDAIFGAHDVNVVQP